MVDVIIGGLVIAACLVITLVGTRAAIAAGSGDRSNDNVMTAALRLTGAAFVFLAAFAGVSEWQTEGQREALARQQFVAAAELYRNAPQGQVGEDLRSALVEYAGITSQDPMHLHAADQALESMIAVTPEIAKDDFLREEIVAFEDRHAERLLIPEQAVPWPITGAVFILGLLTTILVARYPMGSSRGLKILQAATSLGVVVAILAALMLLRSPSLEAQRLAEIPRTFLESVDAAQS